MEEALQNSVTKEVELLFLEERLFTISIKNLRKTSAT